MKVTPERRRKEAWLTNTRITAHRQTRLIIAATHPEIVAYHNGVDAILMPSQSSCYRNYSHAQECNLDLLLDDNKLSRIKRGSVLEQIEKKTFLNISTKHKYYENKKLHRQQI